MKAAILPDRGVVKVAGDDARTFLNGMLTTDITKLTPEQARFSALLTPQAPGSRSSSPSSWVFSRVAPT